MRLILKRAEKLAACLALALAIAGNAICQSVRTPDTAIGDAPLLAYDTSDIDSVNTANGNLYLKLPLLSFPQRGQYLRLNFNIYYNDKSWYIHWNPPPPNNNVSTSGFWAPLNGQGAYVARDQAVSVGTDSTAEISSANSGTGTITLTTNYLSGYVVTPDGSPHYVWNQVYDSCQDVGAQVGEGCPQLQNFSTIFPANDSSGFSTSQLFTESWQVKDRQGVTYNSSGSIIDVDGNSIQTGASGWTDSVGRMIQGTNNGPGYATIPAQTGSAGGMQTIPQFTDLVPGIPTDDLSHCPSGTSAARSWTVPTPPGTYEAVYYLCYSNVAYQSNFGATSISTYFQGYSYQLSDSSGTVQLLTAIVLPNQTSYTFSYDSYLSLTHLGLPSGGSVDYTWQTIPAFSYGASGSSYANPVNRALATRTINRGGGLPAQTWHYTWVYEGNSSPELGWSIVTDPAGNDTEHQIIRPTVETARYFYQGCGPHDQVANSACSHSSSLLLKSEQYELAPISSHGASSGTAAYSAANYFPSFDHIQTTSTYTTSNGTIVSEVQKTKTPGYGSCQEMTFQPSWNSSTTPTYQSFTPCYFTNQDQSVVNYDYGAGKPGSLLDSRTTQYMWQGSQTYLAANMLDLVSSVVTKDGSTTWSAETDFSYDENNGSPQGVFGNLTSTTKVNNQGANVVVHGVYDSNGELTNYLDGNGGTTSIVYMCGDSLVQSITDALGHKSVYTYDCGTGLLTEYQDPNNVAAGSGTTYQYDALRNPILITRPDTGTTGIQYNYSYPVSVQKTVAASPDPAIITTTRYDGFLHPTQQVNADGSTVETQYDVMYRVQSVTNPHFSSQLNSDGLTTYTYDALSRVSVTTKPDGSKEQSCYLGLVLAGQTNCSANATSFAADPWMDQSDESGMHWQRVSDAEGRLISVVEPSPDGSFPGTTTNYAYDSLSNLTNITQVGNPGSQPFGGQVPYTEQSANRSFTYDSLSQLITAANPETGMICFGQWIDSNCSGGYDLNGNRLYKTDAVGTLTTYKYDLLNRMTSRSFSDQTPSSVYTYDTTAMWGASPTNGIGRLVARQVASSPTIQQTDIFYYDPMGRVTVDLACAPADCGRTTHSTTASYDLAGNMTSLTYPDFRVVNQKWDSAGRLSTITDATPGGPGTQYFGGQTAGAGAQYWPSGSLETAGYGNGSSENVTIDSRLVPCHATAASSSNGVSLSLLDRQSFYNASATAPCGAEGSNNGNIYSIVDNLQVGLTQSFTYDGLNRLRTAGRSDGAYSHAYNYDSFGNMIVTNNLTPNTSVNYTIDPATNRLLRSHDGGVTWSDYEYDSTGALTQSGDGISPTHTYQHNAMGQLLSIDGGQTALYFYDAEDERVLKQTPTESTDYAYFNGQPFIEWNSITGYTDYILANGRKIAKIDANSQSIHVHGDDCSGCQVGWVDTSFSSPIIGYQIQAGDKLFLLQKQVNIQGGFQLNTQQGGNTWPNVTDQNGDILNVSSAASGVWEPRWTDLSQFAGQTVSAVKGTITTSPPSGVVWDIYYRDVVIVSTNGAVHPVFTDRMQPSFTQVGVEGQQDLSASVSTDANATEDTAGTHYYLDDHLGSTQIELSSGGWPVWSGQFTPFGQEIVSGQVLSATLGNQQPGDGTNMHYKFTGKERDSESGLDYFGARYYGSSVGRFVSADWSIRAVPVPYAKLDNPQSLNLYSYVGNNPLSQLDADGHNYGLENGQMEQQAADAQNQQALQEGTAKTSRGAQQQSSSQTDAKTAKINSRAQSQYNNDVPIIAKQLGVSTDEVLDSVHIDYDANGRAVVIGGHVNMTVDDGSDAQSALAARLGPGPHGYNENPATGEGQGSEFSRLGTTPSLHLDNGLVHVDRFNAGAWGGLGVVPHFFYDVVYGGMHGSTALLPY